MLSVLIAGGSCIWWDFYPQIFPYKLLETYLRPMVALMYADWCPQCRGIPKKFENFASKYKDNKGITFTKIPCDNRSWCYEMGARSIPYITIIKGQDPGLWRGTNNMDHKYWEEFVENHVNSIVQKITDNSELGVGMFNTLTAGSYFHLVIEESHKQYLNEFKDNAKKLLPYDCKFTYKYKSKTKPSLRVYRTPLCMYKIKGNISGFWWFMNSNKYSYTHQYKFNDLSNINKTNPLALYYYDGILTQVHYNSLLNISKNYCGKLDFGFADPNDKNLIQEYGTSDDLPFLHIRNFHKKCSYTWYKRMLEAQRLGLFDHALTDKDCGSFREGYIVKKNPDKTLFSLLTILISSGVVFFFVELRRLLINLKVE